MFIRPMFRLVPDDTKIQFMRGRFLGLARARKVGRRYAELTPIVTTATKGGKHFYNLIDGVFWDLAADQFDEPIPYANTPSSVEAALADSSAAKRDALLANIARLTG